MKSKFKYILLVLMITILIILFIKSKKLDTKLFSLVPMTINTTTPATVRPFIILIVPGHDTNTGGANFKNIYERNLVVDLADNISALLSKDSKYKVIVARDKQSWNSIFADYFTKNKKSIIDFKNEHQAKNKILEISNPKKITSIVGKHTTADEKTSLELYGINKWADENNIDLVIHVHFNSSTIKNKMSKTGPYHGFNIFIPEKQRFNASNSRIIAQDIYDQLKKKFTPQSNNSSYDSLYEDYSLIALGASDTLSKPAILIEYAYIYEKIIQNPVGQKQGLEQMAEQTVVGIQDYFNSK